MSPNGSRFGRLLRRPSNERSETANRERVKTRRTKMRQDKRKKYERRRASERRGCSQTINIRADARAEDSKHPRVGMDISQFRFRVANKIATMSVDEPDVTFDETVFEFMYRTWREREEKLY